MVISKAITHPKYLSVILAAIVTLVISSCNQPSIPLIKISTSQTIGFKDKVPCSFTYVGGNDSIKLKARIEARGGVSSKFEKQSFAVKLPAKFPLGKMPADNDWIINANYIDKTFMRHKLSYDLFRQMDARNLSPRCAYVNLELNGEFNGLYVLMERLDGTRLKIDKSDSLAMIFKDPPVFLPPVKDTTPKFYNQEYPSLKRADHSDYLQEFINFLNYADDETFAREIGEWIDLRNVIDWHLLLLLTNNEAGATNNFYLYKKNDKSAFLIAIWDYDHTFGRKGNNELNIYNPPIDCNKSILLRRLKELNAGGYNEELAKRYRELRDSQVFTVKNIFHLIRENNRIIKGQVGRNFDLWPVESKWYADASGYKEEVALIKEFVKMRINALDEIFKP